MNINENLVMIFGGTGTLGQALMKELSNQLNVQVLVISRDEQKQFALIKEVDSNIDFMIGDVRNSKTVDRIISLYKPKYVINLAAMKHVGICEKNPQEAILTNITGEQNILAAVEKHDGMVFLSVTTDKVVNSVCTYGLTKALQERVHITSPQNTNNIYNCVRMGNIYGSSGSVVPIFEKLLSEDKPLKVTHSAMSRFFIKKENAAKFIVQCLKEKGSGNIFIPKMKSTKIVDLALALMKKFNKNVEIEFFDSVPTGERLRESLFSVEETRRITKKDNYFILSKEIVNFETGLEFSSGNPAYMMSQEELEKFVL